MFITIKGITNEACFDARRITGVERFTGKEYDGKARDEVEFPCLSVFTPEGKTGFRFDSEVIRHTNS